MGPFDSSSTARFITSRDLRAALEARGHQFRSDSDTGTILHLYEDRGADAFERLEGMFALAIWDARHQRLLLARDRSGKKPLFYHRSARHLVFASEIKALMAHPAVPLDVDLASVGPYFLHGYVPCPATPYRDIHQVPPATIMIVDRGRSVRQQQYWRLRHATRGRADARGPLQRKTAIAEVRRLTTEAVEPR